jgi:hypothetical protein
MSKKQVIELEWFSVDEALPDVGKSCLIRMSNSKVLLDYYYADEWLSMLDHDNLPSSHKVIKWCYTPLFLT